MTSSQKAPPHHEIIQTEDGSMTLFSHKFQEACHSTTGAKKETELHYIKGCQIKERISKTSSFTIFEVGFGLGVGFLTTLNHLTSTPFKECHFISTESDSDLIDWFMNQHPEFSFHWDHHPQSGSTLSCSIQLENIDPPCSHPRFFHLTILVGDARREVPLFFKTNAKRYSINAIYQDAFSPKKNPTLWTKEWFLELKKWSSKDCILSTYSASTSIRKSLHEAHWGVFPGEKFGPKRSSTRAFLHQATDPLILDQFQRSPSLALYDKNILSNIKKV